MSRIVRNPAPSTLRRSPASRSLSRAAPPAPPVPSINRSATRGAQALIRSRAMHTKPLQQDRNNNDLNNEDDKSRQQERSIHVGDGYHMFTPATTKREQMRRQAENEQRQYEAHVERTRLHNIHEVHRLGGDELSEDEVRRRQAEKYRQEKFLRLEKTHQEQSEKKQQEEKDIEAKKQTARQQAMENDKRNRDAQPRSMRPKVNEYNQGATRWTNETREAYRQETMGRFLNRLTNQYGDMNVSSDRNEMEMHNDTSKSEKLSILRDMLPHIDDKTLESHLEIYNGNINAIVAELAD